MKRNDTCHVCEVVMQDLPAVDQGFCMDCEECDASQTPVCRDCVRDLILRDIDKYGEAIDDFPCSSVGGVILEAYSEVVPT